MVTLSAEIYLTCAAEPPVETRELDGLSIIGSMSEPWGFIWSGRSLIAAQLVSQSVLL